MSWNCDIEHRDSSLLTKNVAYDDIHWTMPRYIQDRMYRICRELGVSIWDREKVYNQLQEMSRKLAFCNKNEPY